VPDVGAEAVIVAEASHLGGFSLFVQDGKLKHTYVFLGVFEYHQESEGELPTGDVNVQMTFKADEAKPATPGEVTLFVDGEPVGSGRIDQSVPSIFSGYAGMDVGRDNGLVVDRSYADKAPFAFTGTVKKVVFDVAPHLDDDEHAIHEHGQGDRRPSRPQGTRDRRGGGLVVGLFSPPLLAATVVGGAVGGMVGKFAKHRVESGLEEKMGAALPPGSAGIVAIYDRAETDTVNRTLVSAVKKSVAQVDRGGAKELKAALTEAQGGMGG
jgi:Protein of unknown function (DUF1269)